MPALRDFWFSPWRAVLVLGVTQILCWGAIYYTPVLMAPLIAQARGWSETFTMGGFSVGLLIGGFCAPAVGRLIDRHGGHRVMPFGALLGAAGLAGLVYAAHPAAYLLAWAALGASMSASLYDPAFATLGRIFGLKARAPITALTLIAGFASTVSWPVTYFLIEKTGWRETYLFYAGALALIAAPLLAFALPRMRAELTPREEAPGAAPPVRFVPPKGRVFFLVATAFTAYAFVPSGLSAHMLAMFGRLGIEPATVVAIGALFGPAQVLARLGEATLARNVHPLAVSRFALGVLTAAFALLWLAGLRPLTAAAFAIMYGMANGLLTITRGTAPLSLFGAAGYGAVIGRISGPTLVMQAVAPFVLATIAEKAGDSLALAAVAFFGVVALACFAALRARAV